MTDILSEIDSIPTNLAFFPLALLTIGLISVINLVSLVLTLLLIPIIVAAHLISSVISRLDHQQVLALDGIETLTNKLLTLEGYLEQTNCTIEDLYATYSPENHEITIESLSSESKFKFQVFSNKSASAKSIHSFFKLNIGQISNECEIEESKLLAV
ncbi:hypothetical protein [Legionella septentrionalis]|uniref:hypothetical protein n=1 Tax=Legionella septentrionalis TaxID=2498109 RepID=UPI000F8C3809|nr:hypothetical protein [Legionella septentrionalis]RUQ97497.1 hypothetical protein ELY11_06505 [Legionella septentrionalis]RUR09793.1 hypothetical protein ELY14_07655 [Legionella septentrionalis]